jgi:4-amino-4-deoxy-L-arabinose transferase-like glycosyltransferase
LDLSERQPKQNHSPFLLYLILLFAATVRLLTLNHPFQRDPEGCGSFYGLLARNYLRWPLSITLGVPVQSLGVGHGAPYFYPNHPGLLPMLIALVECLFGDGEWQTRLPTAIFTVACVWLVYALLVHRAGARAALLAAAFFAITPMVLLFGGQPDVINSQLVFFILLSIAAYLRFHENPSARSLLLLAAAFAPAGLTDWPAFHLVVVLGIHFVCTKPIRKWPWIIAFGFISLAVFMIPYGQGIAIKHDWRWMSTLVQRRTLSNVADSTGSFTFGDWIRNAIFGFAYHRHNGPILPLTVVWIFLAATQWRKRPETKLIALVLAWAALHVLIGRQGVYVHEWWWWPLTPAAAMAAGVTLDAFWPSARVWNASLIALLVAFAGWNYWHVDQEWRHPKQITNVNDPLNYSLAELGQAIRAAAPQNEAVMLGENDQSLALWYYADRPLTQNVWSGPKDPWDHNTLEEQLASHEADLPFAGTRQQWTGPVAAYILPRTYDSVNMKPMIDYLNARYPHEETAKFLIWKLPTH